MLNSYPITDHDTYILPREARYDIEPMVDEAIDGNFILDWFKKTLLAYCCNTIDFDDVRHELGQMAAMTKDFVEAKINQEPDAA